VHRRRRQAGRAQPTGGLDDRAVAGHRQAVGGQALGDRQPAQRVRHQDRRDPAVGAGLARQRDYPGLTVAGEGVVALAVGRRHHQRVARDQIGAARIDRAGVQHSVGPGVDVERRRAGTVAARQERQPGLAERERAVQRHPQLLRPRAEQRQGRRGRDELAVAGARGALGRGAIGRRHEAHRPGPPRVTPDRGAEHVDPVSPGHRRRRRCARAPSARSALHRRTLPRLIGYKWTGVGGFTAEAQGGLSVLVAQAHATDGTTSADNEQSRVYPLINLNLGWSF
jgi:hypothetical protein